MIRLLFSVTFQLRRIGGLVLHVCICKGEIINITVIPYAYSDP